MHIKLYTEQTIAITPKIMAEAFFQMDDTQQREFFEEMVKVWDGKDFDSQMWHVTHNGEISWEALELMRVIGMNTERIG